MGEGATCGQGVGGESGRLGGGGVQKAGGGVKKMHWHGADSRVRLAIHHATARRELELMIIWWPTMCIADVLWLASY